MALTPLYDPANGQMRVVGLMSGSGTNLRKIIEFERQDLKEEFGTAPYKVVSIFTDNLESKACAIAKEYDIPIVANDIRTFYAVRGKPRRDLAVRAEFDAETVETLRQYEANVAAYAGYMSIATKPLIDAFFGVNVHPADLSILDDSGKRKYTGDHAVRDAILAGEKYLSVTTHIIEPEVDGGRILMVSSPLEVRVGKKFDPKNADLVTQIANEHQNRLKEAGDWTIFPLTMLNLATGRFAQDEQGKLYFDGKPIPNGVRIENP